MNCIYIITMNNYPNGDAGAIRQHAFARIFKNSGYDVLVLGYGYRNGKESCNYGGIDYMSFKTKNKNRLIRLLNRLIYGIRVCGFLKNKLNENDIIFVVDVFPLTFKAIEKMALKRNVLLVHDSVEWYSPEEFINGERNIEYKLKEYTNTKSINRSWKVFSISSFLHDYFVNRGIQSIRIPVMMDVENMEYSLFSNNDKVTFVYAGGPGLKDKLSEMLAGFALLKIEVLKNIQINIVGVNKEQLISICHVPETIIEELSSCLNICGRVSIDESKRYVRNADFSIFLRNEKLRYAKAGFPTKFVESLSLGTPVICNISSDIGMYLVNGDNGIVVESNSKEDFSRSIQQAVSFSKEKRQRMRFSARETAERYFDIRRYTDEVISFIKC